MCECSQADKESGIFEMWIWNRANKFGGMW